MKNFSYQTSLLDTTVTLTVAVAAAVPRRTMAKKGRKKAKAGKKKECPEKAKAETIKILVTKCGKELDEVILFLVSFMLLTMDEVFFL